MGAILDRIRELRAEIDELQPHARPEARADSFRRALERERHGVEQKLALARQHPPDEPYPKNLALSDYVSQPGTWGERTAALEARLDLIDRQLSYAAKLAP